MEFCEVSQEFCVRPQTLTAAEVVDDAARKAETILAETHRGLGDTIDAAMYRAESAWGIPHATFFSLRYRRSQLADIKGSVLRRIDQVFQHIVAKQEAKLRAEVEITRRVLGDAADSNPAVRAAAALVGPATGPVAEPARNLDEV